MNRWIPFVLAALVVGQPCLGQNTFRERMRQRIEERQAQRQAQGTADGAGTHHISLAGLKISVWQPQTKSHEPLPVVLFSHGFHGGADQSARLMQEIANAGYFVFAPNHEDARWGTKPLVPFGQPDKWSARTYTDRRDDMKHLLEALKADAKWSSHIDFSRLGLVGHSLGGYTVLGLDGGWPSWRMDGVKAVVAWSPYSNPLTDQGALKDVGAPVMYQTGTRDNPIKRYIVGPHGAYGATGAPKELVVIDGATHFAWTNLDHTEQKEKAISFYTIAWLDKFLKGSMSADPTKILPGATIQSVLH